MFLPQQILEKKLQFLLTEDIGQGDITTGLLISEKTEVEAAIIAKEAGIIAGIEEANTLLNSLNLQVEPLVVDGEKIQPQQILLKLYGKAQTILTVERTLLNIISRMSGIATITNKLIKKIKDAKIKVKVACTRKTAPGLLYFDKKAVLIGGGDTHRFHLDDLILVKDNHIAIIGDIKKAILDLKEKSSFSKKIEIETSDIKDVLTSSEAGADIIMLDNFSPKQIKQTIKVLKKEGFYGKILLEASGGITTENILDFASTGVDIVSLSAITNSVKSLDVNLEIIKRTN
jgi:nicotinate-nucleotide pyrophosphorylase (carboxylating)